MPPDNAGAANTRRSTGDVKQSILIRQPGGTIAFVVDFVGADMKNCRRIRPSLRKPALAITVKSLTVRYNPVTKAGV